MHQKTAVEKNAKRREFIINGNMFSVIALISIPLIIFNIFNYIYGIIDMLVVANMPDDEVQSMISSIALIEQIKGLFAAIGSGLASGCGIMVSRLIGKNNYQKAKTVSNTLVLTTVGISIALIAVVLPFSSGILRLCGLSENLINLGLEYFTVQIVTVGVTIFNTVFFSLEKSRGATQNILYINLAVIIVKIGLTLLFVSLGYGMTMVAVATLIANLVITVVAVSMFLSRGYLFKLSTKDTFFKSELFRPYFSLAVPVFLGRFVFSLGKVIVSSNASHYGENAPGALGVSNHISGSVTNVCNSIEESAATVISQNIGAGNFKRIIDAFVVTLIYSVGFSLLGLLFLSIFNDQVVGLFSGGDSEYANLISSIFAYEKIALIPLSVASSVTALIYGLGYNRLALVVNLMRLFVFRVPVIYILIYGFPQIGAEALGIAMMISNCSIGLLSIGIAVYCITKIRRNKAKDVVNI